MTEHVLRRGTVVGSVGLVLGASTFGAVLTLRQPEEPVGSALVAGAAERAVAANFVPCARADLGDDDYGGADWLPDGVEIRTVDHWNGREFTALRSRPSSGIGAPGTADTITPDAPEHEWAHPLPYQIEVGDGPSAELMTVIARTGNLLTVRRSAGAVAHPDGARVTYCPRLQRIHLHTDAPPEGARADAVVAVRGPLHVPTGEPGGAVVDHPAGGRAVSGMVRLDGAAEAPTGTITFSVFGPDPSGCTTPFAPPIEVPVTGNGPYAPPPAALPDPTSLAAGTYRWIAEYSGDSANSGWRTLCDDVRQHVVQPKAQPRLEAGATAPVTAAVGSPFTVPVALRLASGGPRGSLEVRLHGPEDPGCTGPALITSREFADNGTHPSGELVAARTGTWRWTASWSGDGNNEAAAAPCDGSGQQVTVSRTSPVPVLTPVSSGARIGVTLALRGAYNPTGPVRFTVFAGDACAGPELAPEWVAAATDSPPAAPQFPVPSPGVYSWQVRYDGDVNNGEVTGCQPVVARYPTALTLVVTTSGGGNLLVASVQSVSGARNPTGTVRFRVYAGGACAGPPLAAESVDPVTDGPPSSAPYAVPARGVYSWQAGYDGDADNAPALACQAVTVTTVPPPAPPPVLRPGP